MKSYLLTYKIIRPAAPPLFAPGEGKHMKTQDKLYIGALAALFYVVGVVGGMSSFAVPVTGGLIRCAAALVIAAVLVSAGLKMERAKH